MPLFWLMQQYKYRRIPIKTRKARKRRLIKKYGLRCFWCGKRLTPKTATIEHLLPQSKGGTHSFDNLRLACYACNHGRSRPKQAIQLYYKALMENTEAIRQTLQDFRREALTKFMLELLKVLKQEGYTFEDLLEAIANIVHSSPELSDTNAACYMEKAIALIFNTAKQ